MNVQLSEMTSPSVLYALKTFSIINVAMQKKSSGMHNAPNHNKVTYCKLNAAASLK